MHKVKAKGILSETNALNSKHSSKVVAKSASKYAILVYSKVVLQYKNPVLTASAFPPFFSVEMTSICVGNSF